MRREGWSPKGFDRVCSAHFKDTDFDRTGQTVRLHKDVEPSIFDLPPQLQKACKERQTWNSSALMDHDSSVTGVFMLNQQAPQIKEEPEEQSITAADEQLPVSVPDIIAVVVKSEEEFLPEDRDDTQRENFSFEERTEHSPDTDNDEDWETSICATGLFPKTRSAAETSFSVHEEDTPMAEGVQGKKKHQCSVCKKKFRPG